MARNDNNFMRDEIHPTSPRLSYGDGFRFGMGMMIAVLLLTLIVGALAFGVAQLLHTAP